MNSGGYPVNRGRHGSGWKGAFVPRPTKKPSLIQVPIKLLHEPADLTLHGYALKKEVYCRTEGAVSPGAGSLYRAIGQLEEAGFIEESRWRPGPSLDDDRRRYFRVTAHEREAASSETHRLAALVEAARASGIGKLGRRGRGFPRQGGIWAVASWKRRRAVGLAGS